MEEVAALMPFYNVVIYVRGGPKDREMRPRAKALLIPTRVSDHEIYEGGIAKEVEKL